MRKIVFVIAGVFLASFVIGRAESRIAHQGFAGPAAWAQSWDDSSSDASSQADDSESNSTPPNVAGSYTGTVMDKRFGNGAISAMIDQNGSKLSGTWESAFSTGVGTIKGTVSSSGEIKARFKIKGACGLNVKGSFANGDEISGTYKVTGCGKPDHGTFVVTD